MTLPPRGGAVPPRLSLSPSCPWRPQLCRSGGWGGETLERILHAVPQTWQSWSLTPPPLRAGCPPSVSSGTGPVDGMRPAKRICPSLLCGLDSAVLPASHVRPPELVLFPATNCRPLWKDKPGSPALPSPWRYQILTFILTCLLVNIYFKGRRAKFSGNFSNTVPEVPPPPALIRDAHLSTADFSPARLLFRVSGSRLSACRSLFAKWSRFHTCVRISLHLVIFKSSSQVAFLYRRFLSDVCFYMCMCVIRVRLKIHRKEDV